MRKIPNFYLISWCGDFVEIHSFPTTKFGANSVFYAGIAPFTATNTYLRSGRVHHLLFIATALFLYPLKTYVFRYYRKRLVTWNWLNDFLQLAGEHYTITDPRGYEFIIQEEAKGFRNKIRFHHEVKSIERRPDSIYRVTTSSWERFYARHVLVTFSTGVLLSDEINFKPSLPIWKQQALLMVPMGHHCKIFMMFPRAFWDNKGYILLANKLRGRYMHYQNYKHTALFPNSNILLLTMTGQSCHDSHHLSDAEITQEIMVTLRRVYPFATYPTG